MEGRELPRHLHHRKSGIPCQSHKPERKGIYFGWALLGQQENMLVSHKQFQGKEIVSCVMSGPRFGLLQVHHTAKASPHQQQKAQK